MEKSDLPSISLSNKSALVVGGGGHLCSAISFGFAGSGAKVYVADLRIEKATEVANKINSIFPERAFAIKLDASKKTD